MNPTNTVELVGTVATEPCWRELAAQSQIEFRVNVPREETGRDSVECFALAGTLANRAAKLGVGKKVAISGSLRSRFWNRNGQVGSRLQVEIATLRAL